LQCHIEFSDQGIEQSMPADQAGLAWVSGCETIHLVKFLTTMRRMLTPLIQRLSDCHVREKPKPRRLLTQCT